MLHIIDEVGYKQRKKALETHLPRTTVFVLQHLYDYMVTYDPSEELDLIVLKTMT